ncbi:RNase H domain-containing protein [Trichonephila clavipes]|nr:RNase H domain-containing protein [Trichonephila clavipes]
MIERQLQTAVNNIMWKCKSTVAPVVFQRVFAYHSQYSRYSAIYTDGSKRADYVGCGVVIEDIMHGYRLDTSCSVFTAEAVAIYRALQLIDSTMPRKYCIYTDSMSVLEKRENYHDRCHQWYVQYSTLRVECTARVSISCFCWLPSHVGIIGNEQADSAAKSATTHLPLAVPLSDMKRVIMHHIFKIWQESWSQQLDNKLHSVKPVIGAWPVMPMRRTDVKLTRLRIGHTRFTHRHLLFGGRAPECPSCHVSYTVPLSNFRIKAQIPVVVLSLNLTCWALLRILEGFFLVTCHSGRRITIKDSIIPTVTFNFDVEEPHIILTTIKSWLYFYEDLRPCIPNPLRCFTSRSPLPIQPNMEGAGVSPQWQGSHGDLI